MIKEIRYDDVSYKIYLPNHETDHLQRLIKNTSRPYELGMLQDMESRLNKDSVVLDVGANIGNHALYLAIFLGCQVVCFEPDKELCRSIQINSEINEIKNISIHNVAVGSENTVCHIVQSEKNPESVGSQQVVLGSGNVIMTTLDDFNFDRVDCIKIDVEGFEENVLIGAQKLIKKNKPIIYVEAWDLPSLQKIVDILGPIGYINRKRFNATPTYLFSIS